MAKKRQNIRRGTVQAVWTVLTNSYAKGFMTGAIYTGSTKAVCVPGLNCYSCPGALGACPIGSLQAVIGSRQFSLSFYVLGFLAAVGSLFGRFVCGWLCPFGFVQDLIHKIPFSPKRAVHRFDRPLRYAKFLVLGIFVIALPLLAVDAFGLGDPWYCKYICPSGTLMAGWPLAATNTALRKATGVLFAWKSAILVAILLWAAVTYRPFCRYFCPLGALYGLTNKLSLYRLTLDPDLCIDCGRCEAACKLDVPVLTEQNSVECIRCGDCTAVCPTGALTSPLDALFARKKTDAARRPDVSN